VSAQGTELTRVRGVLREAIIAFCALRLTTGKPVFHADDLRDFVASFADVAPGSPDRVLRDLRKHGVVRYTLESRTKSRYRIDGVTRA
jgi:hypothetical protein